MVKALLVKCHKNTIHSAFQPIICEPLELEYLSSLLEKENIEHRILDRLLDNINFEEYFIKYMPDILFLTGYITAVDTILKYGAYAKNHRKTIKIIVGGTHAEVNYRDFFSQDIDLIQHQGDEYTSREVISFLKEGFNESGEDKWETLNYKNLKNISGIAYRENDKWKVTDKKPINSYNLSVQNRSIMKDYKGKTRYMHYRELALLKTSISCPYSCRFCYCKEINRGIYLKRPIEEVILEIKAIDEDYIWIVDDTFLIDRASTIDFIDRVKKEGINKKWIAYSRADFIANNEDIIKKLAEIGFVEIIAGIEDSSDEFLDSYEKGTSKNEGEEAVRILKENNIRLTALFLAGIDFKKGDFKRLRAWIKKMKLKSYTVSIFTPIKGTELYEEYKDRIDVKDFSKYDFLHLVLRPTHMSKLRFYMYFYMIYVEQFFSSPYIRSFLKHRLKEILKIKTNK